VRVLVIDEAACVPTDSGKRIRTFELLRRLASEFEIAFAFHDDGSTAADACDTLRAAGIEPMPVSRRPLRKHGLPFAWDLLRNLPMQHPYMAMAHRTRAMRRHVAEVIAERQADLVHVEWTPLVENVPGASPAPVCISAHNVESEIWDRYRETEPAGVRRAYIALQGRKVHRFEAHALGRANRVIAVSERDAERLRELAPRTPVDVVPNGVDIERFAPQPEVAVDPDRLVFVGSLDWRPNQDAVLWFVEEILPRIAAARPRVRFDVVGRSPPEALRARLGAVYAVELHASVRDVRPYRARAAAEVVPLRIGGGSRLKICEALAMARPVVSTRVGAEGLDVGDGVRLADGVEEFAAAVLSTLDEPAQAAACAGRGRERILTTHAWDRIAPLQASAWRRAANSKRRAR
jgi:glycosyltransferase involved in cell wall biosynthesis